MLGTGRSFLDYATVAYDGLTGEELWVARYDQGVWDTPTALSVSPSGRSVYVTGSAGKPSRLDFATVSYDAHTGGKLWVAAFDGSGFGSGADDIAWDIAADTDLVFVTGGAINAESDDAVTIAYPSTR
jgi:hypothetical protein